MCEEITPTEAAKELAQYVWDLNGEWDYLEENPSTDPKENILYLAAIILDEVDSYLETFYNANPNIETHSICMDCFYEMFMPEPGDYFQLYYGDDAENKQAEHRKFIDKMCLGFKSSEEIETLRKYFSTIPCDCCGSKLHGERHWINLYK